MKTLPNLIFALGLMTSSAIHGQSENFLFGQTDISGVTAFTLAQINPLKPDDDATQAPLPRGPQPVVPVPPESAPGAATRAGVPSTRTLDEPGNLTDSSSANIIADPTETPAMTVEQLAAISSEELLDDPLDDPFQTPAATVGARTVLAAANAVNQFKISGLIHTSTERYVAIRQNASRGNQSGRLQILSLSDNNYLKIPSQPELKLKVLEIKNSSVIFEVEGTNEVVTVY